MTNSAPTTFDTSRIVTLADIIDDGNIDKTADFDWWGHFNLIKKIEAYLAVVGDLTGTQLDNLAAYFTSLSDASHSYECDALVIKLWSVVGASSEKNAIGLHILVDDFLVRTFGPTPVRTPLQGCMTLAEHTEQAEQAKEQAKRDKEQKIIDELNAWAQERSERRAQAEQAERWSHPNAILNLSDEIDRAKKEKEDYWQDVWATGRKQQKEEEEQAKRDKEFEEFWDKNCEAEGSWSRKQALRERAKEQAERAELMDDLKGLVMLGLFPAVALFPFWFPLSCLATVLWLTGLV